MSLESDAVERLEQHRQNRLKLLGQKAVYGAGEIPLHLLNQIEAEEAAIRELEQELALRQALLHEIPCPYRGLEPFEAQHSEFYFGRRAMVQKLVDKVRDASFVAVVGPSGSGKSSLVRAGLVMALRDGALPGSQAWAVRFFRPGADPCSEMSSPLSRLLTPQADEVERMAQARKLADYLRRGEITLADVARQLREGRADLPRLVLVADQFEEMYTECQDQALRQGFVKTLLSAPAERNLTVVLTLRADFYGRVLADRQLGAAVDAGQVTVLPMSEEELREAIERPAQQTGRSFEAGLVDRILEDVSEQPGNLPLLEFALAELWGRQTAEGVLTHAAYEAIGGVSGAIARRAEEVCKQMDAKGQGEVVQRIFLRLTHYGEGAEGTRRRVIEDDLVTASTPAAAVAEVVKALADARLLVTGQAEETKAATVEVAHEALIRGWDRLRHWLDNDRAFGLWRERVAVALELWEETKHDEGTLLRGALLAEAEGWLDGRGEDLNAGESGFIRASLALRAREAAEREGRRRRIVMGLAAGLIGALLLLAVAAWQWQRANESAELAQKQLAQLEGERLVSEARVLKEAGDAAGAMARLQEAVKANANLKLDVEAEMVDVRRQVATKLVQEGEALAAAGKHAEAIARFQAALDLDPPPDTPVYVHVPAGKFTMGSSAADLAASDNEKPQHTVSVGEFWIMRTEVTNAQYLRCVQAGACQEPTDGNVRYQAAQSARQPVSGVDWNQAVTYAGWAGGRLPTEAEWEKACRGVDGRIWPWGDEAPTTERLNSYESGLGALTDVGSYPKGASPYGALDMAGNVWEWTSSLYQAYPYNPSDGREAPTSSVARMLRGGSWFVSRVFARCAARDWLSPLNARSSGGFRVVSPAGRGP